MTLLILGLALWWGAHLFKRVAPAARAGMGGQGRAMVTALLLVSLVLMVIGYRAADGAFWWGRSPALVGINNLLMLVSVYLFAASGMKTAVARRLRHPMLWGVVLWMLAHLLVNGDAPSLVLFGGIGLWALVEMVVINRAGPWTPPVGKGPKMEIFAVLGTVIVYGAISGAHYLLGYPAFG
ncbi:MAG: NnrU family protein [Rhodobacterales bacterium]|nr:NnrU family protein [Rhodobacterales bacterium]MDX5501055.1 NnrU family protein [Rhodobacterales bacterium]